MRLLRHILLTGGLVFMMIHIGAISRTARAEGFAGKAGAFLRMGAGAASVAGGEAGVGRSMGVEQAHYNPAGLPFAPNNEVHAGYHILSLDRHLAHVGVLYQVSNLSFWSEPLRALDLRESTVKGDPLILIVPGSVPGRRGRILKVHEYIEPLADTILLLAEPGAPPCSEGFVPLMVIKGIEVEATALSEVVRETVEAVRLNPEIETREQVIELLEEQYRSSLIKPAATALSWTHAGTGDIEGRDMSGRLYGTMGYYENRFALSFGLKVIPEISFGITAGVLYALIPDMIEDNTKSINSTTFGADLGMQVRPFINRHLPYRLETFVLGAAAYDIAAKNSWNTTGYWSQGTTKTDHYPRRYRGGFSYMPLRAVEVFMDLETDLEDLLRPKGGVEYTLFSVQGSADGQGARTGNTGYSTGNRTYGLALRAGFDRDHPAFGLGLELRLKGLGSSRVDYAYVIEPVSPEPTQIVSWRFRF